MIETLEKMSQAEYESWSESVYEKFASDTPDMDKAGAADMDVMVRKMVREGAFFDSIITPRELSADENVIQMDTDQHVVLIPFEPDSPGAMQTYLDGPSNEFYAYGRYFPLRLQEFVTDTVVKNMVELETYKYDIRQILGDNMVKDLNGQIDYMGMEMVNRMLGAANSTNTYVGRPLYQTVSDAITYHSWLDSQKLLYDEPFNLEPTRMLLGRLTVPELQKTAVDEFRGTKIAEDFYNGALANGEFGNMPFLSTTKKALVPEGSIFYFPEEKFMGASRTHTPPTMFVKRERTRIQFGYYMIRGMALGHLACATRTDFSY